MPLRSLHRASAWVIAAYALVHIVNHLTSVHSVALHMAFMKSLRGVYRQPVCEVLLLGCVAFQVGSGLRLVVRGWAQRAGRVAWLQACSGLYLAFFLVVHVAAVLFGRAVLKLDTNFYYAAAGLHVHPYEWFFAPYYAFAVAALFAHLGCALYWSLAAAQARHARFVLASALGAGVVAASLITLALAGYFEPIELPAAYRVTYESS